MDLHPGGGRRLSPAQALALDGHGVVYSRNREVVAALIDALQAQGWLSIPQSEAKSLYLSIQERAFAGEISYQEMLAEFARGLGLPEDSRVSQLHTWVQAFSADIVVDPDLPSTLAELRARGVTVAMVTNSVHPAAVKRRWLEHARISHLFNLIVSSVDEGCRKPSPEIFRQFAAKVSLRPECTVFVGHDVNEVMGAKEAGMITVCLRCSCPKADYEVQRLAEVVALPIWPPPARKEV